MNKKTIRAILREDTNKREMRIEGYQEMSPDMVNRLKKLSDYPIYDDKLVTDEVTYLNFITKDDWHLWGDVKAFDNHDGTEIGNVTYGKEEASTPMKASIDVRPDKRRMGIASNMYQWVEKLVGEKLYPDSPHSSSAEALWSNPNRKFGK